VFPIASCGNRKADTQENMLNLKCAAKVKKKERVRSLHKSQVRGGGVGRRNRGKSKQLRTSDSTGKDRRGREKKD